MSGTAITRLHSTGLGVASSSGLRIADMGAKTINARKNHFTGAEGVNIFG